MLSQENENKQTEQTKTSFIIKSLFPILSISIILIGLIILYRAGNVEQYITDAMRIGFGYFISFSLLGGYFFDKVRKTFFSQILLSTVLSSLTITTLIGTNVYSVIPNVFGIILMFALFVIGLYIAYTHKSEVEFTTTAIIGALIPVLFHSRSFALFLTFECGLFIALYIYLYFFKNTKVFQYILYWSMYITISVLCITGICFYNIYTTHNELLFLLFFTSMSFIAPILLSKWQFISEEIFTIFYFLQLVTSIVATFFIGLTIGTSEMHAKIVIAGGIMLLMILIWASRKHAQIIVAAENIHIITFFLLLLLTFYLLSYYPYKVLSLLILVIVHTLLLNFFFDKTRYTRWKKTLTYLFYGLTALNALPFFIGIFSFILHISFTNSMLLHDKLMTASFFLIAIWGFYFTVNTKRGYALEKSKILVANWIVTALYFLYIPWQIMSAILPGNGLLLLVLISLLWLSAAFTTTIIALRNGRLGLRIFTIIIMFFLTAKLLFIDLGFFLESNMAFELSLYIITFGIATLILSRLLILEYAKNGSLLHEWQKFIQTLRAEKKRKEALEYQKQKTAAKTKMQQHVQPNTEQKHNHQSQQLPQSQPEIQNSAPLPDTQTKVTSTVQNKQTLAASDLSLSETHIHSILNLLTEQWEQQQKVLKTQQQILNNQQQMMLHALKAQEGLKTKIEHLINEIKK